MSPDIGIIAVETYFPKRFIQQTIIELSDGCPGKYTNGLGQHSMGVCDEAEDSNSMALTVTKQLIDRTGLDLNTVGFLEVASESLVDKSKATKTVLMSLFEESGNFDLVGIDVKSACYGSTAAFFNAINWLESSSCDGRLALVVAADIAVYATKTTQPTGGAGAVAILLGPNAPIVVDPGLQVSAMRHRYDFYKPVMRSLFPEVDGHVSVSCYKEALLSCYNLYRARVKKHTGHQASVIAQGNGCNIMDGFPIDFACFHSPFCRLVAKSFAWLALQDAKTMSTSAPTSLFNGKSNNESGDARMNGDTKSVVDQLVPVLYAADSTDISRTVDDVCLKSTEGLFTAKVQPSLAIASQVGNMYTASLYSCLVSLCCSVAQADLRSKRVLMFAYGSGYTASMFSLRVLETADLEGVFGRPLDRLSQRSPISHQQFLASIWAREEQVDKAPLTMSGDHLEDRFFPGTFYLTHIDEKHRRFYSRTPSD